MSTLSNNFYDLWRAYKTIIEMLQDRKYIIPNENVLILDYLSFMEWTGKKETDDDCETRKELSEIFKKPNGDSIMIMFYWENHVGNREIQIIRDKILKKGMNKCLLVVQGKITTYAVSAIRHLKINNINIESYYQTNLLVNMTYHELVPRHIICSTETKNKVLKDYSVKKESLPQISVNEPIMKYLGAVKGQLIKILRESETMSEIIIKDKKHMLYDITYRLVV